MRLAASLAVLLALAGEARAVDCATASSAVDKGLCAEPALVDKEQKMATLLAEVAKLSEAGERAMLDTVQQSWLAERSENCGDLGGEGLAECLHEGLDDRIGELLATPDSGPGVPSRMIPVYVSRQGDATHYAISAQGFRFAEPKSAGEILFNAHVAEVMAKLPLAAIAPTEDGDVLESDTGMSIKYASPKLISAAAFWWRDSARDGMGGLTAFNVNLETGKDIAIADIVSERAAAELVAQCRERIIAAKKDQIDEAYDPAQDTLLKDEVIAEHVATLSRWMIGAEEVAIQFATGAIGAEDEGDYECLFTVAELKALALPGAPLPD